MCRPVGAHTTALFHLFYRATPRDSLSPKITASHTNVRSITTKSRPQLHIYYWITVAVWNSLMVSFVNNANQFMQQHFWVRAVWPPPPPNADIYGVMTTFFVLWQKHNPRQNTFPSKSNSQRSFVVRECSSFPEKKITLRLNCWHQSCNLWGEVILRGHKQ